MNETIFLLMGVLGIVGIASLISDNDDAHPPEGDADDPYKGRGEPITGTNEADTILGTDGDDAIQSFDGNDLVDGGAGDDLIWTGFGQDTVLASAGNDEVYLGGNDDLYGAVNPGVFEGNDTIDGGSGNDTIITNLGNHSVTGGSGNDRIEDHGGTVFIDGEDGDDLIWSPDASSPDARDTLFGGDGNDTIHAGAHDLVDGGDGSDLIVLRSDAGGPAIVTYGGSDSMRITLAQDYDGPEEFELVQQGDNVRVLVNGEAVAVLRDIRAEDVRNISLEREMSIN